MRQLDLSYSKRSNATGAWEGAEMRHLDIALTGATGFIGRYVARHLLEQGHRLRCAYRSGGRREGMPSETEWVKADLRDADTFPRLVEGCDAVVHAALWHPSGTFRGNEGDLGENLQWNLMGSLALVEAARQEGYGRFVFVSTCAVHERILDDTVDQLVAAVRHDS